MQLTITKVLVNKVREYQGRLQWPVLTVQYGDKQWVTLDCAFEPQVGQSLDCTVDEKPNPKGGTYKNARYYGPAPQQAASNQQDGQKRQSEGQSAANSQSGGPGGIIGPARISWEAWCNAASAMASLCRALEIPNEGFGAVINTTLISIKENRLDPPPAQREPGQDDDTPEFLR